MPEVEPQAILTPITEAAIFLVLTVDPGFEDEVRGVLEDVAGLRRSVGFRVPEAALTCVVGIGSDLWDRLFGAPRPAGLHRLPEFAGAVHAAVTTPGDLLGFVDGTENPEGAAARAAVVIGDEDPGFAAGSYVIVQIVRHNMPFGRVGAGEFGTYFIGYARSPDVIEQMLTDMFIGKPPGTHDRILDVSTAVTGNLSFVPSAGFLDDPPAPAPVAAPATDDTPGDGSLGIGSLQDAR